jgi:hypothetical protein
VGVGEHRAVRPKITARLADPEQRRELTVARSWGYKLDEWRNLPDEDRDLLLAEHELICPQCGNLRSDCSDPERDWFPQESVCWATATLQSGKRDLAEFYADEKPQTGHLHPLDGVTVWASDVDRGNWSPDGSGAAGNPNGEEQ